MGKALSLVSEMYLIAAKDETTTLLTTALFWTEAAKWKTNRTNGKQKWSI